MSDNYYRDIADAARQASVTLDDLANGTAQWSYIFGGPVNQPNVPTTTRATGPVAFWAGLTPAEKIGIVLGIVGIALALKG